MNLGWPNHHPPDDDDAAEQPVKIDERWLSEYADYGLAEMRPYLNKHAAFAAWLDAHPQPEGDAA